VPRALPDYPFGPTQGRYETFSESLGPLFAPSFENVIDMFLAEMAARRFRHENPFGLTQPAFTGHRQRI
jgi:hypothetical protein